MAAEQQSSPSPARPPCSSMVLTAPVFGPQTVTYLNATASTFIAASTSANTNYGSLATISVATSNTADHSLTKVGILKFSIPASAADGSLTSALLRVTVNMPPPTLTTIAVVGLDCTQPSFSTWTDSASHLNVVCASLRQSRASVGRRHLKCMQRVHTGCPLWRRQPQSLTLLPPPCDLAPAVGLTWNTAGFLVNLSMPMNTAITDLSQNHVRLDNGNSLLSHLTVDATNQVGNHFMVDITGVRVEFWSARAAASPEITHHWPASGGCLWRRVRRSNIK